MTCGVRVLRLGQHGITGAENKYYSKQDKQDWFFIYTHSHIISRIYSQKQCSKLNWRVILDLSFFNVIVLGSDAEIKKMEYVPKGVYVVVEHRLDDLLEDNLLSSVFFCGSQ